ncbi:MAG: AMIN domain-containing protein, partial [Steroidobacteraceae bacterium]
MIKKVFQLGVILLLGAGWAVVPAVARGVGARLSAVSLTASAAGARVTLDLSRSTGEKLYTLEHPYRAVIDLPRTRARPGLRLPGARGLVASIRVGRRPHGALRLVLLLNSAAGVHAAWAHSRTRGSQLILTLGDSPAALAAAAAPAAIPTAIQAPHAPVDSGRDIIVAVDAGHGGQDPGAIGLRGTEEK